MSSSSLLEQLQKYARQPAASSNDERNSLMRDSFERLMGSPSTSTSTNTTAGPSHRHWFCEKADQTTIEAATFLIRLHAYQSKEVPLWKNRCAEVIYSCCDCNMVYQNSKIASRITYLSDYPASALDAFFAAIDKWEVQIAIDAYNNRHKGFADSPTIYSQGALYYHILANPALLKDATLFNHLTTETLAEHSKLWPRVPPAGILVLFADSKAHVRAWADQTWIQSGLLVDDATSVPSIVVKALTNRLLLVERGTHSSTFASASDSLLMSTTLKAPELWGVFHRILRLVSPKAIREGVLGTSNGMEFCKFTIGHLSDARHLEGVLQCFTILVRSLGPEIWAREALEYPEVVIDSIKDNPSLSKLLSQPGDDVRWALDWIEPHVDSVRDTDGFSNVLAKAFVYLGEELQHPTYDSSTHVQAYCTLFKLLQSQYEKSRDPRAKSQATVLRRIVSDKHAQMIATVAFGSRFSGDAWIETRALARRLLDEIFDADARAVVRGLHELCRAREQRIAYSKSKRSSSSSANPSSANLKTLASASASASNSNTTTNANAQSLPPIPLTVKIHFQLWEKSYSLMTKTDPENIALLIHSLAKVAHLDDLRMASGDAFSASFLKSDVEAQLQYVRCVKSINEALSVMRKGFASKIEGFAESSGGGGPLLKKFLQRPHIVEDVLYLMLSPIDDLNESAKVLALNAYDTIERSACYYAFFQHHPTRSFDGVISYLRTFNEHATILPEACGVSKYLVRSLTDILGCLCDPSGLLSNDDYGAEDGLNHAVYLPRLWKLMTESLSIIFRRVKLWAPFYSNEDMVIWMRDALIFGRDMVAHVEVLQMAALSGGDKKKKENSSHDTASSSLQINLVSDLSAVLTDLIEWLKLTDEETLHQAHELLKSLLHLFASFGAEPPRTTIDSLEQYAARRKGTRTQLDDGKLTELLHAISPFMDEARILEVEASKATTSAAKAKAVKPVPVESEDEIEYIGEKKAPELKTKTASSTAGKVAKPSGNLTYVSLLSKGKALESKSHGRSDFFGVKDFEKRVASISKAKAASAASTSGYKPKPGDEPSDLAIQNYRKLQGPKNEGTSGIVAARNARPAPSAETSSAEESEDSDGEEDDDEEDEGDKDALALLRKKNVSPKKAAKHNERRQIKILEQPFGRNIMQERLNRYEEARRNELRLKPDLGPFHRYILNWNYDHDGPDPPGIQLDLTKVPNSFPSQRAIEAYRQVFEPLILLETWSSLIRSKEETIPSFVASLVSRKHTDNWLDLDIAITEAVPQKWYLGETDIVLLRQVDGTKCILAKINMSRRGPEGIHASIRCSVLGEATRPVEPSLVVHSKWMLSKVLNLSTVHREYAALMGLPYYDLFRDIVHPQAVDLPRISDEQVSNVMQNQRVNQPQAVAIAGSLQAKGFSLIQGPPGTGKTSTIVGLVGAFLARRPTPATTIHPGRASRPEDREPPKKVLICAPSNAAIDEVAHRLKQGVRDAKGALIIPNIVRIGSDEKMHPSIKDISLDELVASKLTNDPKMADLNALRESLKEIGVRLRARHDELETIQGDIVRSTALEKEISQLKGERARLGRKLDAAKDANVNISRNRDSNMRKWEAQVLHDADVICTTLSGSGHYSLSPFSFETVIIDEAAQSIELSSLIPLKYRCTQCILVGDPKQLAPTVLSPRATNYMYNQSLFVRLQKSRPDAVYLLSIQYRMHPEISVLPSSIFYDGRLKDGDGMAEKRAKPWHVSPYFKPYQFFNVADGREETSYKGHSQLNRAEIQLAIALFERLRADYSAKMDLDVGVISMYDAQKMEMKRQFSSRFASDVLKRIDFGTVDGFQGQEKDIIIMSCVRAGPNVQSIGHLVDTRRMNVAITRARCSLFILGNAATLQRSDETWSRIVQDAQSRSHFMTIELSKTNGQLRLPASTASSTTGRLNPKVPLPKKVIHSPSVAPSQSPAIPIMKPKELPKSYNRPLPTNNSSTSESSAKPLKRPAPDDHTLEPGEISERSGPVSGSSAIPATAAAQSAPSRRQPLGPPPKRPKREPTLFIPSKRPPPPAGGANKRPRP